MGCYHNKQFWTEPDIRDERRRGDDIEVRKEPLPDEFEMHNLTRDPLEEHNLADPNNATPEALHSQQVLAEMLREQVGRKRLARRQGDRPGYAPLQI